jgi:hypothetical protein
MVRDFVCGNGVALYAEVQERHLVVPIGRVRIRVAGREYYSDSREDGTEPPMVKVAWGPYGCVSLLSEIKRRASVDAEHVSVRDRLGVIDVGARAGGDDGYGSRSLFDRP